MERALITGAAGFIGSHLAAELLCRGWSVTGLDARSPASDPVAAENLAELTGDPRFQFVAGDVTGGDLALVCEGVRAVFHLAGLPGVRRSWGTGSATTWPATSWAPSGCWRHAPPQTCHGWCSPRHPASTGRAPGSRHGRATCRRTGCRSWRPSGCAWRTRASGERPPA